MGTSFFYLCLSDLSPMLTETQLEHKIKVGCIKNATLVSQNHKTETQTVARTDKG
jgi:hypothetical protein